jgi:hypothetical protein
MDINGKKKLKTDSILVNSKNYVDHSRAEPNDYYVDFPNTYCGIKSFTIRNVVYPYRNIIRLTFNASQDNSLGYIAEGNYVSSDTGPDKTDVIRQGIIMKTVHSGTNVRYLYIYSQMGDWLNGGAYDLLFSACDTSDGLPSRTGLSVTAVATIVLPNPISMHIKHESKPFSNIISIKPKADPWLEYTTYHAGDLVNFDGYTYSCLVTHESGTFATDLAASKWLLNDTAKKEQRQRHSHNANLYLYPPPSSTFGTTEHGQFPYPDVTAIDFESFGPSFTGVRVSFRDEYKLDGHLMPYYYHLDKKIYIEHSFIIDISYVESSANKSFSRYEGSNKI